VHERTERQTDRTKLIVAFRSFVNAPDKLVATFMIFIGKSQFRKLTGDSKKQIQKQIIIIIIIIIIMPLLLLLPKRTHFFVNEQR